jgi:hypothetical protein
MSHDRTCVIKLLNSSAELYRDFFSISFQQLVMDEEKVSEKVTEATANEQSSFTQFGTEAP